MRVDCWEDSEEYITAKTFYQTVKTTNDLANRAIWETATDYSQILSKDEDTRRRIIQAVEGGWSLYKFQSQQVYDLQWFLIKLL